jgi:hypothetical protein
MSKKQLNTLAISNELEGGASLFFAKHPVPPLPIIKHEKTRQKTKTPAKTVPKNTAKEVRGGQISQQQPEDFALTHEGMNGVNHDVTTSPLHEVTFRVWKDLIENTETHNSSLRLTNEENYAVEDMINELKRSLKIKTSLNEVARLGLLYIIRDFTLNREKSLVYKVKKS